MSTKRTAIFLTALLLCLVATAQAPGTTPVKVSHETQVINGRRYYVHIVEKGQTVYSISKAYKVQSFDAVTHKDIHFLHPGDTVWLPHRGQFGIQTEEYENPDVATQAAPVQPKDPEPQAPPSVSQAPSPTVKEPGSVIRVSLLMPLYLDQIEEVSTSKFDVEQRGKRNYKQFEFIEFYEGILLALEELADKGVCVDLNVVDIPKNSAKEVREAFAKKEVVKADVIVALLFRDAFDEAAKLAQENGVYIVNPMTTRSELCTENPYLVKIQPSLESQVSAMLANMHAERPDGHLYIIHGGGSGEKKVLAELRRQIAERGDIKYTLFNWSQSGKLASVLKTTPGCHVLSVYEHKNDQMRVYASNLLNRLSALKNTPPTLYTLTDWTEEYADMDYGQLQLLNYHTFYSQWNMLNPFHAEYLKRFRQKYGAEPTSTLSGVGYDLAKYIVGGLNQKGSAFWNAPGLMHEGMTAPIWLKRRGAGLENTRVRPYVMESLHFIPARER